MKAKRGRPKKVKESDTFSYEFLLMLCSIVFVFGIVMTGFGLVSLATQVDKAETKMHKTELRMLEQYGESVIEVQDILIKWGDTVNKNFDERMILIKKNIKNISYLIHRVTILEEQTAKLEAQMNLKKCEEKNK